MPFSIGIVGAARRRQGTGPFVARTLHQLGHRIAGVVGTSAESGADAVTTLKNHYAIETQAYTSVDQLLAHQPIDILAICSPPSTHLQYLQQALAHDLHVFCEKPLWWTPNHSNYEQVQAQLQALLDKARQKKCYIHVNTQWPYTLRDFYRLHPDALAIGKVEQFAMHLCPQSRGLEMLVDAASHGLSMLYQLTGAGELTEIEMAKSADTDFEQLNVRFKYLHMQGTTETTFGLTSTRETPKPARYEINGLMVNRNVALPDYEIQLQSERTTLNIMDPLITSIRDFIANIEAELECDTTALELGINHLNTLIKACR